MEEIIGQDHVYQRNIMTDVINANKLGIMQKNVHNNKRSLELHLLMKPLNNIEKIQTSIQGKRTLTFHTCFSNIIKSRGIPLHNTLKTRGCILRAFKNVRDKNSCTRFLPSSNRKGFHNIHPCLSEAKPDYVYKQEELGRDINSIKFSMKWCIA